MARLRDRNEPTARERTALELASLSRPYLANVDEDELQQALADPAHPLFAYAHSRGSSDSFGDERADILAIWDDTETEVDNFRAGARVVLDFGPSGPLDRAPFLVDGPAFGSAPVRAGDVRVGLGEAPRIDRIHAYPAAAYDPAWSFRRLVEGTQREDSSVDWVQSGRTLRTPTVTLEHRYLCALVRGPVNAFAVVDGHRMLKGPLHGGVIHKSNARDDELRWITLDLEDYAGHGVQLELTPFDDWHELEVLAVVASDLPPPSPELPLRGLRAALVSGQVRSAEELGAALEDQLSAAVEFVRTGRTPRGTAPDDLARLAAWLMGRLDSVEGEKKVDLGEFHAVLTAASRTAPAILDGAGFDEHLLIRGSHLSPGDIVPRRLLEVLRGKEGTAAVAGSGRLDLARRMTDPSNPLVARVQVNRVWKHLFGRGLVATVDNFGVSGVAPANAELLDHLAVRFMRAGWSGKALIRTLVLSSAYRQSSAPNALAEERDPTNELLHRMPVRRLTGEMIRDSILAVSGRLDRTLYGPSIPIHLTPFLDGRGRPASGPVDGAGRRSIYLGVRRNFLSPFLQAFDFPTPATTVGRRGASNVPAQALTLMNDPFVVEEADRWGHRVAGEPGGVEERISAMYLTAFGRRPSDSELRAAAGLVRAPDDEPSWQALAHVLFNVKEFIFLN